MRGEQRSSPVPSFALRVNEFALHDRLHLAQSERKRGGRVDRHLKALSNPLF